MIKPGAKALLAGLIVLLGWFALILQFDLIIINRQLSLPQIILKFFSYFTILTNILVAIAFSYISFVPASRQGRYFSSASTLTAITVYIMVVSGIYNILLRPIFHPQGLNIIADELLHSVVPLLTLAYWISFVNKGLLNWRNVWGWLAYPLAYLGWLLLIGGYVGYPYPFVDVVTLGYIKVLINALGIGLLFAGLSLLMIAIGKITAAKKRT